MFPGAVIRVEYRGHLLCEAAFGSTRDDDGEPVFIDTVFDLASLTKLFVATAALRYVDCEAVELDETLVRWIPSWRGTQHEGITLRRLLAHTSGMHSGADYRLLLNQRVESYAMHHVLAQAPGSGVIYSDLGFIALGLLLGAIGRTTLPKAVKGVVDSTTLEFRPAAAMRPKIPATERDAWRGHLQGVVHDEKAYLMGGVAGHAGLFGTAADVAKLAALYLETSNGTNNAALSRSLAHEAVSEQAYDPVLRRGLGWALKTNDENSCGRWYSAQSFGHTGFTGTCAWSDPKRLLNVVLLTNSVYFGRKDTRDFRASVFEAVVEDLALE